MNMMNNTVNYTQCFASYNEDCSPVETSYRCSYQHLIDAVLKSQAICIKKLQYILLSSSIANDSWKRQTGVIDLLEVQSSHVESEMCV